MTNTKRIITMLLTLALLSAPAFAQKIKIEKLDDLPRHTYKIDVKAVELFDNDEAFNKLMAEVKRDLLDDLEKYEIPDKNTVMGYYGTLGSIALLEGRWDDYRGWLDKRVALEDKESLRLTSGLFALSYVEAVTSGAADLDGAIAKAYAARLEALPYKTVEAELKSSKGMAEMFSRNLIEGLISTRVQKTLDESGGEMGKDIAHGLVRYNQLVRMYLPHKEAVIGELSAYLDAHEVVKTDIWAERNVILDKKDGGTPVVVCIWDSGSDPDVFKDVIWTNTKEIPNNDIDDDKNGFVDDVHGIAYTLNSDKTEDLLFDIGDVASEAPRLQKMMKGLSDLQANIESEEASELKTKMATLKPEEAQPFIEGISKYGMYCHGTHVAGIALEGNPLAQLMVARITFNHKMIPELPTIEQAEKDAKATYEYVEYFQQNGARVVNMSWGGDYAGVEAALETHNAGGTPEERKILAREIFEIGKQALVKSMEQAPDILFVTSAGNENNDVEFDEVIPSSFDLPNMIVVGAVDQAGDETGFTSFGKVEVYANGFEVESFVPGGDRMKLSGTSQASPQVSNLAAKMLAVKPDLTPARIKELIIVGADEKQAGDRTIRLINPKKTMALLNGN